MTKRRALLGTLLALTAGWGLVRATRPSLLPPGAHSRAVTDREGQLLRLTLAQDETYRLVTPLDDISPQLVQATLDYEDRHFFRHSGVNPVAVAKAFAQTYVWGGRRRGGSTLTMQLARMRFDIDSRTPWGKAEQMLRALHLEAAYSKRELLEAYLNLAPYGGNVSGVGAAARIYFHKAPSQLSLPESLALAVMPQSPTARAPKTPLEPDALRAARTQLAHTWQALHQRTTRDSLALDAPLSVYTARDLPFLAPHAVAQALATRGGDQLTLTLDAALQAQVERQVANAVERGRGLGIRNAAALLVDVTSNEVVAHVGSADFFDAAISGQVDGVAARRSPGSALKPFVYARALDEGLIHPRTLLKDVPMRFGAYNPENFDNVYLGPMSATEALVRSRNVPAVELNVRVHKGLHPVLSAVGVQGLQPAEHYGAGIVLGAVELSMEELVQLYVALARGGTWHKVKRVRGEVDGAGTPLLSKEAAALTLAMLESQGAGLDRHTTSPDAVPVAWKTGTSYAFRDAWTVGVVGKYALAVWVGNFDGTPNPSFVGRVAAAPLFFDVVDGLRPLLAETGGQRLADQANLAETAVCATSGLRPGPSCPSTVKTQVIPGVSPIHRCDVHRVIHVDAATGRRRCQAAPPATRDEVYEVWPSDIAQLFARAGLARRALPPGDEPCDGDPVVAERPPSILSPQPQMTYHLRRGRADQASVPLLAHADGAARRLTWFAGHELIGDAPPGVALEWSAPSGDYALRAVDDRGNAAQVAVSVRWLDD